ncbi:DUF3017 domain-containing protein [Streptomyces sp. NRRL_ISP-5395]|uniref:DUF3017 domain-containing protein n=1 Tax=Streptomyces TaxID=1883 RepID=UPI0018734E7A|nr:MULTISPECIES: DUF3017 domain-containing protein [Streptomyces]MDX2673454.1 DUF3017 domain-containing protein [Streptomyces sp. NRRL_ISP-5395]GHF62487.1 membrane protein [Streptomyces griseus]
MGAGTSPAEDEASGRATDEAPGTASGEATVTDAATAADKVSGKDAEGAAGKATAAGPVVAGRPRRSRRFPRFTRDTARPEGGGRAASGDAPAPARQWPLLTVLCAAGLGLLIVVLDPFDEAFRVGTILIGGALIGGAVLRWVVPSVGMLAVRSRFTDLVTYGLMGTLIVLLALVAQPEPWLDVPILEDAVRFTIR